MEQEANPDVKAVFQTLSEDGKKLLISMSHGSHESGMRLEAIQATSGLKAEKLEQALSLLTGNSLVQHGKLEEREFNLSKDGNRYRLPLEVRKSVLSDIVKLDKQQVDELLKY